MSEEIQYASEEDRRKIVEALKAGRVRWNQAYEAAGMPNIRSDGKADFTVVSSILTDTWASWEKNQGGIEISWATVSAGFGTLTITLTNDDKVKADTEGMSKKFCKEVVAKLVLPTSLPKELTPEFLARLVNVDEWTTDTE